MRLLVVNFEMDRLSRTMPWSQQVVDLLAERCEQVVVLTSRLGDYRPPANVHVHVVPIRPMGIPQRFGSRWLLNFTVFRLARQYRLEACFIHMAIAWAYRLRLAFALCRMPVLLWYAHGTVTSELRRALRSVDRVVTSTSEGFRLPSPKVRVIGQGVDTNLFRPPAARSRRRELIAVTRISRRKRNDLLVDVMWAIKSRRKELTPRLRIIGAALTPDDAAYESSIRSQIASRGLADVIDLMGFLPQTSIAQIYEAAALHINVSKTGSMDKTVLEALAAGCPVLTSNEAFFTLLHAYPEFIVQRDNPDNLAEQVLDLFDNTDRYDAASLRGLIQGSHDVNSYVSRVHANLEEMIGG
jgi:glycosyltransferase involved in cell wall biosynthesis